MSKTPIKDALGLGEVFTFSNGATLPVAPASLADIEDAMQHYFVFTSSVPAVQFVFVPGNEKAKESLVALLEMATGRTKTFEEIKKAIYLDDGGQEVVTYIERFLRLIKANPRPQESPEG